MGTVSDRQARPRWARAWILTALTLGLATLVLIASPGAGSAAQRSADELSEGADRARDRADSLAGEVEQRGESLSEEQAAAATAAARGAELGARLSASRGRIAELEAELADAQGKLEAARKDLRRTTRVLSDRLVEIYKHGQPDGLDLLLSSDGYDQLATTAEYLQRIKQADDALITRARDLRAELNRQTDEVSATRDRQQALDDEIAAAAAEVSAVRAEAERRAASIAAAIASSRGQIGALRKQADRFDRKAQRATVTASPTPSYDAPKNGWAIPEAIVMCESGGNWSALNPVSGAGGAYQILPSTWKLYGGKGLPHEASPAEQSRIAAMIWADSGSGAWVCKA